MTFWTVIWVVLMLFWLFCGSYIGYSGAPDGRPLRLGGSLLPWACVAILGALYFGAIVNH